ncbi:hypothetical protein HZS_1178, partial [Henneguya salminicola]
MKYFLSTLILVFLALDPSLNFDLENEIVDDNNSTLTDSITPVTESTTIILTGLNNGSTYTNVTVIEAISIDDPDNTFSTSTTEAPTINPLPSNTTNTSDSSNITIIELYDNSTLNNTLNVSSADEACNPICVEVNRNIVLAICLSIFGGLVIIGVFSYLAFYRKRKQNRYGHRNLGAKMIYTPVQPSENIYMEPIKVPNELGIEKIGNAVSFNVAKEGDLSLFTTLIEKNHFDTTPV